MYSPPTKSETDFASLPHAALLMLADFNRLARIEHPATSYRSHDPDYFLHAALNHLHSFLAEQRLRDLGPVDPRDAHLCATALNVLLAMQLLIERASFACDRQSGQPQRGGTS